MSLRPEPPPSDAAHTPGEPTHRTGDQSSETFSLLANHVCRFVDEWEARKAPPSIAEFLPADTSLRRVVLVELIKSDLEYRWVQYNVPKRIHEYRTEFAELSDHRGVPADLIYEEFLVRRASGLQVDPREYLEEFPEHASTLQQLLGINDDFRSTTIVKRGAVNLLDSVQPGETLDDFELLVGLGKGAFAKVFLARQKSMQRLVAVKVSADSGTEPQTLAQLDHDSIVRVFDQRVLPDRGLRLLYMQYVPGGTLHSVVQKVREASPAQRNGQLLLDVVDAALEQRGELRPSASPLRKKLAAMTWPETIAWLGMRLALALQYAHNKRTLHRDVKPANVLLTADAEPKLADFNISYSDKVSGATPAAYFGGSLAYMSPEQLEAFHPGHDRQAADLDGRSDTYSLGVVLCELLMGSRPFREEPADGDWQGMLDRMISTRIDSKRPASQKLAERGVPTPSNCPATLKRVLDRCLAPNPDDRWQTPDELARQLAVCLDPEARDLIDPVEDESTSWRRTFAIPILISMLLVPNIVAGAYNFLYNEDLLKREPNAQQLLPVFYTAVGWVNSVAFPIGIVVGFVMTRRVVGAVNAALQHRRKPHLIDASRRLDCLRLGERSSMICIALWLVSGIVYPLALHLGVGDVSPRVYGLFVGSLTICGLIVSSYPFFLVTYSCVRRLYPTFVQAGVCDETDVRELQRLQQRLPLYFGATGAVPLLAIMGLLLAGWHLEGQSQDGNVQALTMFFVAIGGIAASVATYWLFRRLAANLAALARVVDSSKAMQV
jgi:serine/threonine protein kinase